MSAADARLAVGFAACAAVAATLPLAGARTVPGIVRAAFAIVLAPLAGLHVHAMSQVSPLSIAAEACGAAVGGAMLGLSAAILAGAAASAGALFDIAIAASPAGTDRVPDQGAGPFATLLPLGFGVMMFSSGAFTWLVAGVLATFDLARADVHTSNAVVALGRLMYGTAIALAFPLISAYGLSSLLAAVAARAAPKINGMLLAPSAGSVLALMMALASVPAVMAALHRLAELTARIPHAT